MGFNCPQHQCVDCQQKTSDAGGMIYRCRWCERGYCEDCLDWEKTDLLGENLKEFELLGYPSVTQAFFICCPSCTDYHDEHPQERERCKKHSEDYDVQHQQMLDDQKMDVAVADVAKKANLNLSRAASLTDATTLTDSGISTPQTKANASVGTFSSRKRKEGPESFKTRPSKRSTRTLT